MCINRYLLGLLMAVLASGCDRSAPYTCEHPLVEEDCDAVFCRIPGGCFAMGSPGFHIDNYSGYPACWDNAPSRHIRLMRSFEMQRYEAKSAQFDVMVPNSRDNSGTFCETDDPRCPIGQIMWHEAAAYCNALSLQKDVPRCYVCSGEGEARRCEREADYEGASIYDCPGYRLPTLAEWRYAARAGTRTLYYNGKNPEKCFEEDLTADRIAWYRDNSGSYAHPVGLKEPNAWGLHDMLGNMAEWVDDHLRTPLSPLPSVEYPLPWEEPDPTIPPEIDPWLERRDDPEVPMHGMALGGDYKGDPGEIGYSSQTSMQRAGYGLSLAGVRCVRTLTF